MAIPIKDRTVYNKLHDELKQHIFPPYTEEVRALLKNKGREVSATTIYNVVKGLKKDFEILYALREHFNLSNPNTEEQLKKLRNRQKINLSETDL